MTLLVVSAALLAAAVAAAAAGAVAWAGPVDPPKARSSHDRPTPTSGGLAIVAGAGAGLALLAPLAEAGGWSVVGWTLALAAALGLIGAADDLYDFSAGTKAAAHGVTAAGLTAVAGAVSVLPLGPGLALPLGAAMGMAGSVLFLLVLMNALNFMDGSNGLAPGAGVVSLLGLAAAGFLGGDAAAGAAALVAAGAGAGFLPWNLRGRVFQGDVGALFTAALIGGLGLKLAAEGTASPYLVVFTVLPLLTDVLLTLLVRARRGAPLSQPHREHLYQLWLQAGWGSHASLALRVWALSALCTAVGLWFERYALDWAPIGFTAAVAALSVSWGLARRRLTRPSPLREKVSAQRTDEGST